MKKVPMSSKTKTILGFIQVFLNFPLYLWGEISKGKKTNMNL